MSDERYRWVVTRTGRCLHRITSAASWPFPGIERPLRRLACGHCRLVEAPSTVARIAAQRCRGCCRAAGTQDGSGLPLDTTEATR